MSVGFDGFICGISHTGGNKVVDLLIFAAVFLLFTQEYQRGFDV